MSLAEPESVPTSGPGAYPPEPVGLLGSSGASSSQKPQGTRPERKPERKEEDDNEKSESVHSHSYVPTEPGDGDGDDAQGSRFLAPLLFKPPWLLIRARM